MEFFALVSALIAYSFGIVPTLPMNKGASAAPPTYIQSNFAYTESAVTSLSVSFTSSVTAGDTVLVGCIGDQGSAFTVSSVTDNQSGNTYSQLVAGSSAVANVAIYRATNVNASGTFTVTCHTGASTYLLPVVYEFSIPSGGGTTDGTGTGTGSGTSSNLTAGSTTATHAADVLVSACATNNTTSNNGYTAGTSVGYTLPSTAVEQNGNFYGSGGMEYYISTSTVTATGDMTTSASAVYTCAQAAIY